MCQISIRIPDAVMYDIHMSEEEAAAFARCMVAVGYYTQNNVSIGYCAQIAGMTEEEFIKYLGKRKVSIFQFDNKAEFWRNWRMRRVIVNSTPIIVLCNIGLLDILKSLYAEICIPEAVSREVTEKDDSACQALKTALNWMHVEKSQTSQIKRCIRRSFTRRGQRTI